MLADPKVLQQASGMVARLRREKLLTGSAAFWSDPAVFGNPAIGANLSLIHHITGAITAGEILSSTMGYSARDELVKLMGL